MKSIMDAAKRAKLEAAGFRVGSASEFLGLSREENELIELRLALSSGLQRCRVESGLSQQAMARKLGSSQSRVARMETSDPTVSFDLLIRALLATGTTLADLGQIIASDPRREPTNNTPERPDTRKPRQRNSTHRARPLSMSGAEQ